MYSAGELASTGAAAAFWLPLAGFALVMLGVALWRAAGTFRRTTDDQ
ncbi:LPXTG cell wall anchor domain-containing protein [Kribbella sp. NPDC004875]